MQDTSQFRRLPNIPVVLNALFKFDCHFPDIVCGSMLTNPFFRTHIVYGPKQFGKVAYTVGMAAGY
ncbi:MAG: hypothetical protein ACJ748_02840, partial [Flavisolibacter sp.]